MSLSTDCLVQRDASVVAALFRQDSRMGVPVPGNGSFNEPPW
jgi:hypothetical protein